MIIEIKDFEGIPKAYKLKRIDRLIDEIPILSKEILKTCKWAASYYHHPIGQVVFSALSPLHRKDKKGPKKLLEIEQKKIERNLELNDEQNKIFAELIKHIETFRINVIRVSLDQGRQSCMPNWLKNFRE